jgi:hypothetical protein
MGVFVINEVIIYESLFNAFCLTLWHQRHLFNQFAIFFYLMPPLHREYFFAIKQWVADRKMNIYDQFQVCPSLIVPFEYVWHLNFVG